MRAGSADELLTFSAAMLAVGFVAWYAGDVRLAAWVGAAGALSAVAAVFWRDDR